MNHDVADKLQAALNWDRANLGAEYRQRCFASPIQEEAPDSARYNGRLS